MKLTAKLNDTPYIRMIVPATYTEAERAALEARLAALLAEAGPDALRAALEAEQARARGEGRHGA